MLNHTHSHAIFQRAKQLMPGGVNSPARAFGGGRRRADRVRPRSRGLAVRCRRQSLHRLHRLLGTDDSRARPSGRDRGDRAGRAAGHQFRRTDPGRERDGRVDHRAGAVGRESASGQLGHRGDHERDSAGTRLHRPRPDRQVRRELPRARRQPAGGGRQLGRHARACPIRRASRPARPKTRSF